MLLLALQNTTAKNLDIVMVKFVNVKCGNGNGDGDMVIAVNHTHQSRSSWFAFSCSSFSAMGILDVSS